MLVSRFSYYSNIIFCDELSTFMCFIMRESRLCRPRIVIVSPEGRHSVARGPSSRRPRIVIASARSSRNDFRADRHFEFRCCRNVNPKFIVSTLPKVEPKFELVLGPKFKNSTLGISRISKFYSKLRISAVPTHGQYSNFR